MDGFMTQRQRRNQLTTQWMSGKRFRLCNRLCVCVRHRACGRVCLCAFCDKSKGNHGCVTIFFCCRFVGRLPNLSILFSPANVWLTNARQHIYCMFDIFSVGLRVVFAFASVSFHKIPVSHATFIDIFKGFTDFNRWLFCINSGDEDEFVRFWAFRRIN